MELFVSSGIVSVMGSLTNERSLSSFMHCSVHWSRYCCFFGGLQGILKFGESFKDVIVPLQMSISILIKLKEGALTYRRRQQ